MAGLPLIWMLLHRPRRGCEKGRLGREAEVRSASSVTALVRFLYAQLRRGAPTKTCARHLMNRLNRDESVHDMQLMSVS